MQLEELRTKYPDAPDIGGWIEIYAGHLHVDGRFYASELRTVADFAERVACDFVTWYNEIRKLDEDMDEEPVNCYWHDFCQGKTPLEAYTEHGQMYGRK